MGEGTYIIRLARAGELPLLRDIERAAGVLFVGIGLPEVASGEPIALGILMEAQQGGRVWVAADAGDAPVGFAVVRLVDALAHLEEIAVHPAHGQRGLGRRLVEAASDWALASGYAAITLCTFVDVPWNAPFYARCGFRPLAADDLTPGLMALRQREADAGLPMGRRICMRRGL